MTIETVPVWLDCDPGTDDAFAILLALFHPRFKLLGISTVHGNAPLEATTRNTLGLLEVLGVDTIPVYKGEERPLVKEPFFAYYAHGPTGMGGADLPAVPKQVPATDKTYKEAIRDAILAYPNEICVVATGPYTNMSKVFLEYPELKSKIKYLPVMGGAFGFGNVTKYAEFNSFVDPKAGNDIFQDEILMDKIVVSGLNITHKAVADPSIRRTLFDVPNKGPVRQRFENIMMFYYHQLYSQKGWVGPPLHDPLAIYLLLPLLFEDEDYGFTYIRRRVQVVEGGERDGETSFVNGSVFEDEGNEERGSIIGKSIDVVKFYDHVGVALDKADARVTKETA